MIPIRDTIPSQNIPIVNNLLIVVNVLVFVYQYGIMLNAEQFNIIYGLIPARYTITEFARYFTIRQQFISLFSYMFLHGGILHLLGNMWTLYIFGDNIEDRLGPVRYLIFYLSCGLFSGCFHLLLNPHSNIPIIGASGAIAGVMGAYFLFFPNAKILTLIPLVFIPLFFEIPAYFFLGLWFLLQLINAIGSSGGGIAWWAHVGGFIVGIVIVKLFIKLPRTGVSDSMKRITTKKHSERFQMIKTHPDQFGNNLYGLITISGTESIQGSRKFVNIPFGFSNRFFRVTIPPGTQAGTVLRLKDLGLVNPDGGRGDLLLTVKIQDNV